jgi:uncharacterized membrane protein
MNADNKQLMQAALDSLRDKWGPVIGVTFIFLALSAIAQMIPLGLGILGLIVGGPLFLGYTNIILKVSRGQEFKISELFDGFNNFMNSLAAYLLMVLYILLWSLLLIIPGVIAAISYFLTFYILSENPNMSGSEALRESKRMMEGHKMRLFYLMLRFLGWLLLVAITFGVAALWVYPYYYVSVAKFYEDLKTSQQPQAA